jgi:hypothetical protein
MAIFTPGPAAASISGSVGGVVFSHNRGGPYMRRRPIPVNGAGSSQTSARAEFVAASQMWQTRADATKAAWNTWAVNNKIPNALGNLIQLSGHQAFVQVVTWRSIAGWVVDDAAPAEPRPAAPLTYSVTADIGAGNVEVAFTPTPFAATKYLVVWTAVCDSPGITYVKNLWKLTQISAAAVASPLDIQAATETLWGTLAVGQKLWVKLQTLVSPSGLRSVPVIASALVTTT